MIRPDSFLERITGLNHFLKYHTDVTASGFVGDDVLYKEISEEKSAQRRSCRLFLSPRK